MTAQRLFAIAVIFGGVSVGWMVLGNTMQARTRSLDNRLSGEMQSLWGPEALVQTAPYWTAGEGEGAGPDNAGAAGPSASKIRCDFRHEHRYKGLLWYSTFTVDFEAEYTFTPNTDQPGRFVFPLPEGVNGYDNLAIAVNGEDRKIPAGQIAAGVLEATVPVPGEAKVRVRYRTRGQDVWVYSPNGSTEAEADCEEEDYFVPPGRLTHLSGFSLTVTTDFRDIDYPRGTSSPTVKARPTQTGMEATWEFAKALTNKSMGIAMPKRPNAGPIAARMSLFAPVSLLFFFTVLFAIVVLKDIPLHPMHYLFIAAGFFSFHMLLAYLVDKISIHAAFWTCAAVAVLLVVSYMRLVAGVKFAVVYVGAAQLVYLLGFSYAFFFPGWTGLAVVIGAIVTLFVLMQATGKVNWADVFTPWQPVRPAAASGAPPRPPSTPSATRLGKLPTDVGTPPAAEPPEPQPLQAEADEPDETPRPPADGPQ